jgi:predicted P-loop ATPase
MSDDLSAHAFQLTDDLARELWNEIAMPVTLFEDLQALAGHVTEEWLAPYAIVRLIQSARAREKARLPLLKLARFGTTATAKGSLRHDANVIAVSGIEADYDGEVVGFDAACNIMRKAGVVAILYTSPSHTEDKPRWRVLCPFTAELPPQSRKPMMARLAGCFSPAGVMFSPESWALSQAYYYGGIVNGADHAPQIELIEGLAIDRCVDLDDNAGAAPKDAPRGGQGNDKSRSAAAFKIGARLKRDGATFEDMCEALRTDPTTADWYREKGEPNDGRELHRIWDRADEDQGKRRRNILALVSFITDQKDWQGALATNELTETTETTMRFTPSSDGAAVRRPLTDADVLEAVLYFQARGFPKATKGMVLDALAVIAHRNAYHPVRDYLTGVQWDGTERVGRLFLDYFNAEVPPPEDQNARARQTDYLEHVASRFMISAVARVMVPGCKVDHVPVLIGKQGIGKSTALRALCHDPNWFSDDISPNLIERDTKESLRGKWIIELAEIPHVRREAERVKAFFTRREDRYREAYGMLNRDHARQCVFVGTSNDVEFVDPTGNRRFWPIALAGQIGVARITADRDQLWAEAVALYDQGVQWWLPPNIEAIAAEVQDAFADHDLWEDAIARWIVSRTSFTMEDLFAAETGFMPFREGTVATKADQNRAAACLKRLGYTRRQQMVGGHRAYRWSKNSTSVGN